MSEFWKRKIRKYFSIMDLDSNGVVSREDFVGMADTYAKFGIGDKKKAEHLKKAIEKLWEMFVHKVENGGRNTLTADELIGSMEKQRYDPELAKLYHVVIRAAHDMLDVNRDGYLQEEEHERMIVQFGVPDLSFVKEAFQAIDVNGDGKLSVEEFTNAHLDFLFSEDEKSPFRFFFGPLDD